MNNVATYIFVHYSLCTSKRLCKLYTQKKNYWIVDVYVQLNLSLLNLLK